MASVRLKYLVEDADRHGNIRFYVRLPGQPKLRIRTAPGTKEFLAAYNAAVAGQPQPDSDAGVKRPARLARSVPGSLRAVCEDYYRSPEFKELGVSTRKVRNALLESICLSKVSSGKLRGDLPFRLMESRHVRDVRNNWADNGPEAANARLKALRQLFAWAIENSRADRNPARDVKYLKGNPDGFHTWTVQEVEQFRSRHPLGTKAYLALSVLLYTGTRRCDAARLGPQMVHNGWLDFSERKGRSRKVKDRSIPILPELQDAIDASPSGDTAFLVTPYGRPYTDNGFGNWFRDRCDEAGLKHCSAHGLRKAGATIAAENGATASQLMAIFGWESIRHAEVYTKKANRKKLAADAMHLMVPSKPSDNKIVPPAEQTTERWDDSAENDKENNAVWEVVVPRAGMSQFKDFNRLAASGARRSLHSFLGFPGNLPHSPP